MPDVRPDRHALLELDQLLRLLAELAAQGDRTRYDGDDHYRWVIHRLWIAVGNEALAYSATTANTKGQPWYSLYLLRNRLAHRRLPDIDEDEVWRMTMMRPTPLRDLVRGLLQ